MNARQQLAHTKRLGDVIVGAEVEADDFVELLAFGGEHQNRSGEFFCAKLFADVITAQAGQHDIEEDHGRAMFGDSIDGGIAAIANGHFEAVAGQDFLQPEQNVRIIFDNENLVFHFKSLSKATAN